MKPITFAQRSSASRPGFTVMEILVSVAVITIVAVAALKFSASTRTSVQSAKLTSDVQKLNEVVSVYLANGGSITGTTPQDVLDQLKTVTTAAQAVQNVGVMTGRGVDTRLTAQMQTGSEVASNTARALWDNANKKFYVSTAAGTQGVSNFVLNNALATAPVSYDTNREQSKITYNSSSGWVWAPGAYSPGAFLDAANQSLLDQENKYNPLLAGSGGGGGGGSTPSLPPPIITPPGGAFFPPQYPGAIFINPNGAPEGTSILKYQLNGGAWIIYNGPFSVPSGTKVTTKSFSTNPAIYSDSSATTSGFYTLVPAFTGGITAYWNPSDGPSTMVSHRYNSNPDDVEETDGNPASGYNTGPNSFTFKRVATFSNVPPNSDFRLGSLIYHNGTIYSGTGATTLHLRLNITMTSPSIAETGTNVNIQLDNTINTANAAESADYATLVNPTTNYSISVDGVTYTLQVHYGTIAVSQGYVSGNTLAVWEGSTGTVDVFGNFVSSTPP